MAKDKTSSGGKARKDKRGEKKQERANVVRDSYTMPEADYERLKTLKKQFLEQGVHVKKGELLRAGLLAIEDMKASDRMSLLERIERVKTGRPGKNDN